MCDQHTSAAAQADPAGFVRGVQAATINEIQRAPELLLAIKMSVDEDYRPSRFLLTGSANGMTLPRVADSQAGRIEILRMLPLAQAEISGAEPQFLHQEFAGGFRDANQTIEGDDLLKIVLAGGFSETLARAGERRRHSWSRSWLESVLTRDLKDVGEIEKLTDLPRFVRLLAEHSGKLVNHSRLGSAIDVTLKTSQRYVSLLEQVFVVAALRPWRTNALKRIVKTPKLHFLDCSLLAAAHGLTLQS